MPPDIERLKKELKELFELIDEACPQFKHIWVANMQKEFPNVSIEQLLKDKT